MLALASVQTTAFAGTAMVRTRPANPFHVEMTHYARMRATRRLTRAHEPHRLPRASALREERATVLRVLQAQSKVAPQMVARSSKEFAYGLPGGDNVLGQWDPAGLLDGKDKDTVYKYREAELTHGRVSMLASLGFLVQESFHPLFRLGDKDIGPAIRHLDEVRAEVPIFFEILVLGIGFAEISRSLAGWTAPAGSNPADGPLANLPDDTPFRRLEDKYYPGDIGFDPAGLKPSDPKEFAEMATKELQNGRLAMIAVAGFFLQELVNGKGIIENFSA